ncbi:histidine kinase [Falsibacillus pallidus]|uniref:sensor histidine kinase n=1 Tax=Falsibacillus pallidus TaxID=493781 RepID=UPI003D966CAA
MKKNFSLFPKQYGFFPYIFLVYLFFPFYYLTQETGIKQVLGLVMIVLFLVSYRQLYSTPSRSKVFTAWLLVELGVIFVVGCFYDVNYLFLGFFPANFTGYYQGKRRFQRGLAGLIFVLIFPLIYQWMQDDSAFSLEGFYYFVPFLLIMIASPFGVRSMNRRMALEKELDQANQQIAELVKREERLRISRDLHDTLGHTLSLLTLKSQLIQRLAPKDPERTVLEAKEMEMASRSALKQVRELVSDMRTITIAEELIHIQQSLKAASITYQFDGKMEFSSIPPLTQNIVSMCIREAATNVIKHSKATHCTISISQTPDRLFVKVKDDGMGIDSANDVGNGLRGMEERLALIDGGLKLSNHHGALLELNVPIINKAERKEVVG